MVKHVILWKLKDEFSPEEKHQIKLNAKAALEGLLGKIDGLTEIKLNISPMAPSNAEMMLDSTFTSVDALKAYQVHPDHVEVADKFIRPFACERFLFDFEE
ncbi:MAG: Dabb family protein [Clostridia bacterium]|nr:Dabb family protein [Clostridia bacterium]